MEQYGYIKKEMQMIAKKMNKLQEKEDKFIADTVTGSSLSKPYQKRIIPISGYDVATRNRFDKIEELQTELDLKEAELEQQLDDIESFIASVSDSRVRQIIEHKYINGLTWTATATEIYGYPCGDRARKRVERYIEKINKENLNLSVLSVFDVI